jgi:hypothetical protein
VEEGDSSLKINILWDMGWFLSVPGIDFSSYNPSKNTGFALMQ